MKNIKIIATLLIIPNISHAYLDPGTTSMIMQGIAAFFAGAFFIIKTNWKRIKKIKTKITKIIEIFSF